MWRFKVSKFKNAAPKALKKDEYCSDIPVGNLMSSSGNFVTSSCKFCAFNVEFGGHGKVAVLGLEETGRKDVSMPVIHAHSDFVSDMAFSPFHDDLLLTGCFDGTVKLWKIPETGLQENLSTDICSISAYEQRIENIRWHPSADDIVAVSTDDKVFIHDVSKGLDKVYEISTGAGKPLQSMDWKPDGSVLITSCKDTKLRVIDPRSSSVGVETFGHEGIKDSRTCWLGDTEMVLSTGFGMSRDRALGLWDTRNFNKALTKISIDTSNGILMPFYDPDTKMLFLAGKGDSTVYFYEFTEADPFFTLASQVTTEGQTLGMGLVPKLALDVMSGEVNRLLQLTKTAVHPLKYIVPRKSYLDFHEDLYPDTTSSEPSMSASDWISGANNPMLKVSLHPSKRGQESDKGVKGEAAKEEGGKEKEEAPAAKAVEKQSSVPEKPSSAEAGTPTDETTPPSPGYVFTGVRTAKFRHVRADRLHKMHNIENIRNLSESLAGESDGFQGFEDLVAIPLHGPGGQIAVFQLSKPGRLPETGIPVLLNGCALLDFVMNPFDNTKIAAACEDGTVKIWHIPKDGLTVTLEAPAVTLQGHRAKVNVVRYHPIAEDLVVSAAYDFTVRLWNAATGEELRQIIVSEQVLSIAWDPTGVLLAVFTKDSFIRVYNPREGSEPLKEFAGPEGIRGGRITWGGPQNKWILASGFDRSSFRSIFLYDTENTEGPLDKVEIDVSPSVLTLHYDEDSETLFATGKGDSTIFTFGVFEESPHLMELSHCRMGDLHQGLTFLYKRVCNVREVEFARAARLTKSSVEVVTFTVPRIKKEFFQDDIFPETRESWKPGTSCSAWIGGVNGSQKRISLKPKDMIALSEAPSEAPKSKKYESRKELDAFKSTEQKKEELISAMMDKLGDVDDEPLYQDTMEGVDEDEWDD